MEYSWWERRKKGGMGWGETREEGKTERDAGLLSNLCSCVKAVW